jgi:hypothetical protein
MTPGTLVRDLAVRHVFVFANQKGAISPSACPAGSKFRWMRGLQSDQARAVCSVQDCHGHQQCSGYLRSVPDVALLARVPRGHAAATAASRQNHQHSGGCAFRGTNHLPDVREVRKGFGLREEHLQGSMASSSSARPGERFEAASSGHDIEVHPCHDSHLDNKRFILRSITVSIDGLQEATGVQEVRDQKGLSHKTDNHANFGGMAVESTSLEQFFRHLFP